MAISVKEANIFAGESMVAMFEIDGCCIAVSEVSKKTFTVCVWDHLGVSVSMMIHRDARFRSELFAVIRRARTELALCPIGGSYIEKGW